MVALCVPVNLQAIDAPCYALLDTDADDEERPTRSTSTRSTSARSTRPRTPRCASSSRSTARRVVKAVPDIGYLHSGLREARRGPRLQPVRHHRRPDELHLADRNEIAWHHAVEKLMGIELTPRCKYIRTIIAELARISDHLLCIGAWASTSGASPRSSTPSTSARRSTTSSRRWRASGSTQLHPRRRADERRHDDGSPRSASSSRRSRRRTPTSSGCSTATASSSTAPRASAC
jgi:hypothetical protein